ncbi:DUF2207 domain-containing protein [Gracilimonas mengyeensis]|uniref:Uncharacterized membrane protein n=1 Tax=Gracilimonas mengyeensis TaxID=1302730 RepID=A0A521BGI3_9BACT|nr:DUF2207 domain-containing protein [Gracilimonas mengyeensis]SMO46149.1 Uncharacterized membrane protein [Gracilimonas mengyeensis]
MNRHSSWGIFLISFMIFAMGVTLPAQAKEYTIPLIEIDVQANEDGTVRITEHHTFSFDGSFSQAFYSIPKSGYSNIRDIRIAEGDEAFTNLNSEEPGTFLIEESDNAYTIRWYYTAEDEERTFTISYLLEGALTIGPEWSQFFWNYTSDERDKDTGTLDITIQLPDSVQSADLHSWVRHARGQMVSLPKENGFQFNGTEIDNHQKVTIRTVFPTKVFAANRISITDNTFSLQWAEEDEMAYREEQLRIAEEEARMYQLGIEIAIILGGLSILVFIYLYRRFGSRHSVNLSIRESIMIPGRQEPALIGWLISGRNVMHNHLMATLMDLSRRGYFKIEQREPEKEKWSFGDDDPVYAITSTDKKPDENMPGWERSVFDYVRQQNKDNKEKLTEVFKGTSTDFAKWFRGWKKEVEEAVSSKGWVDKESYKGMYWNLGIQAMLVAAAIVAVIFVHPVLFAAAFLILMMILMSLVIVRRTPKGEEVHQRWKAYREALKNAKEHTLNEEELGRHFIFSIALGVSSQHVEKIFEQHPDAAVAIYWIVLIPSMQSSPADIASSFSTLAASGSSSAGGFSSGGASAGAAGGGAASGAS